jgi:hypothetical protein
MNKSQDIKIKSLFSTPYIRKQSVHGCATIGDMIRINIEAVVEQEGFLRRLKQKITGNYISKSIQITFAVF